MAKFRAKTTGGKRLKAFIKAKRRQVAKLQNRTLSVGFHEPQFAALAATHEFGTRDPDGSRKLPARPAFRQAASEVRKDWKRATRKAAKALSDPKNTGEGPELKLREGAADAAESVRESYSRFHGAPLSERQKARKSGTPGAGRQLVGHKGPRLLDRITARDADGSEV